MCESEENSRLSGSDDPLTVGSSVASEPDCLLGALEALLANLPFSAVTMDTLVTTPSNMEENLDQTEDVCPKIGEENVSFNVNARSLTKPGLKRVRRFCNPDIISSFTYSTKLSLALLFNILH